MSVKFVHFAGIDVSKRKIDVCLLSGSSATSPHYGCFEQSIKGFAGLKKWLIAIVGKELKHLLICIENTGHYNEALLYYLNDLQIAVNLENAANIKRSVRDIRLKSDHKDAYDIARYAKNHSDELLLWQKPRPVIARLKQLLAQRRRLIAVLKSLKQPLKEKAFYSWNKDASETKAYSAGIRGLEQDIKNIDADIAKLVKEDKELNHQVRLITSIPSVGPITAYHLICYTNEFKQVRSGKQLSSYCGVAPFSRSSGSSVRKPARVSHLANRVLKMLLHMCALTATKMKNDFGDYFRRKTAEGKHKMLVINALRNKLALTIAAVVQKQCQFDKQYIYHNLEKP
jgi:transposase